MVESGSEWLSGVQLRGIISVHRRLVTPVTPLMVLLISLLILARAAISCRTDANHGLDVLVLERGEEFSEGLLDELEILLLRYSHLLMWTFDLTWLDFWLQL